MKNTGISFGSKPYLTSPESGYQIFLSGFITLNFIRSDFSHFFQTDNIYTYDISKNKTGFLLGGGFEVPVNKYYDIKIQASYHIIPNMPASELNEYGKPHSKNSRYVIFDKNYSYIGISFGIVF
jgi:hypothetical protein